MADMNALTQTLDASIKEMGKNYNPIVEKPDGKNLVQPLGESARKILDQTKGDITSVFQNALERINDTRRVCDAAEQHIKDKRADVERALFEYIQSIEVLATTNAKMQEAIGDLASANGQV